MLTSKRERPRIGVLGVAFKGNIDDCRESPAIEIVELLEARGCEVAICDPHVKNPGYVTVEAAAQDADLLLVLADHDEFKALNHADLAGRMRAPMMFVVLDIKGEMIEQPGSGLTIVNYGNLYRYVDQG